MGSGSTANTTGKAHLHIPKEPDTLASGTKANTTAMEPLNIQTGQFIKETGATVKNKDTAASSAKMVPSMTESGRTACLKGMAS